MSAKVWKPLLLSASGQTVALGEQAFSPNKVRFDLFAPGFALHFARGIDLRISSTAAPYLTWGDGSATSEVPTPDVKWLTLSFRDDQPPIIFGFLSAPASLTITGKAGAWQVRSKPDYSGWVRVGLPNGTAGLAANSASTLGRLAKSSAAQAGEWTKPVANLLSMKVESDLLSVTGTWTFDRAGAQVPVAPMFANLGGYPIKVESATERLPFATEEGPVDLLRTESLRIRFPVKRVPLGRCLTLGAELAQPIGTASPQDIPSVVDLALETLGSGRDALTRKAAEDTLAEYLVEATYSDERWSGQSLPFDAAGVGTDLAAAHSLLMQAITTAAKPTSEANGLLTSLNWRRDWLTWRIWADDPVVARRATALAALAGALCPEDERRLAAGMLQAGLSAEAGFTIWQRRTGRTAKEPTLLEPLLGMRQALFGLRGKAAEGSEFGQNLLSPMRVFSDGPVILVKREQELLLQWPVLEPKQSLITIAASYPLQIEPRTNLSRLVSTQAFGFTELKYIPDTAGTCEALLKLPEWAKVPPASVPAPRYSEPLVVPNPG